jgi:hypothetical protein
LHIHAESPIDFHPDLAQLVAIWPALPGHAWQTIMAIVAGTAGGSVSPEIAT